MFLITTIVCFLGILLAIDNMRLKKELGIVEKRSQRSSDLYLDHLKGCKSK